MSTLKPDFGHWLTDGAEEHNSFYSMFYRYIESGSCGLAREHILLKRLKEAYIVECQTSEKTTKKSFVWISLTNEMVGTSK